MRKQSNKTLIFPPPSMELAPTRCLQRQNAFSPLKRHPEASVAHAQRKWAQHVWRAGTPSVGEKGYTFLVETLSKLRFNGPTTLSTPPIR
jgi:hypothetical protein